MRRALVLLAVGCAGAPRPVAMPADPGVVPAGAVLAVELDEAIVVQWATPGDPIVGRTMAALRHPSGVVLVPRNARVTGSVVERRNFGFEPAVWVRTETIEMGGVRQRMLGEVIAVRSAARFGGRVSDGSIRGALPRGSRLECRLAHPIVSLIGLRSPR
jgi:hypothetical protein